MQNPATPSRFPDRCDQVIRFSYYALFFFLPIAPALVEIFESLGLVTFFIKRGFLFSHSVKDTIKKSDKPRWFSGALHFLRTYKPVSSFASWPIALFIAAGFISIFMSHYLALSLQGFFFKLLEMTYLFFIFLESMHKKRHLKKSIGAFLLSAGLVVASGLTQYVTRADFIHGHPLSDGRLTSSFKHSNDLGSYLLIVCMLILSLIFFHRWGRDHPHKINIPSIAYHSILSVFFILAVTCLGLSYSRGAWLAFCLALLFLGVVRIRLLPICFMIILIFLSIFVPGFHQERKLSLLIDSQTEKKSSALCVLNDDKELTSEQFEGQGPSVSLMDRLENPATGRRVLWRDAIVIIKKNPLGVGINTYTKEAHRQNSFWSGYPHNCFLQLTAEMGFLGLFAFLWLIGRVFVQSLRSLVYLRDDFLFALTLGGLTGLVGFLVHSFFDTNFYSLQLGNLMWVMIGVIVVAQQIGSQTGAGEKKGK